MLKKKAQKSDWGRWGVASQLHRAYSQPFTWMNSLGSLMNITWMFLYKVHFSIHWLISGRHPEQLFFFYIIGQTMHHKFPFTFAVCRERYGRKTVERSQQPHVSPPKSSHQMPASTPEETLFGRRSQIIAAVLYFLLFPTVSKDDPPVGTYGWEDHYGSRGRWVANNPLPEGHDNLEAEAGGASSGEDKEIRPKCCLTGSLYPVYPRFSAPNLILFLGQV